MSTKYTILDKTTTEAHINKMQIENIYNHALKYELINKRKYRLLAPLLSLLITVMLFVILLKVRVLLLSEHDALLTLMFNGSFTMMFIFICVGATILMTQVSNIHAHLMNNTLKLTMINPIKFPFINLIAMVAITTVTSKFYIIPNSVLMLDLIFLAIVFYFAMELFLCIHYLILCSLVHKRVTEI